MNLQRVATATWFLALAGCPGRIDDADKAKFLDGGTDAGLTCQQIDVVSDIFTPKCGTAGCHDATTMQNGLDLASAGVAMRISTQTSMCMGEPLSELIPQKLTSTPPCGATMPVGGMLTATEVQCVDQYIASLLDAGMSGDAGTSGDGGTP